MEALEMSATSSIGGEELSGADARFWQGRPVLITGHTGFKGSWLSLWLQTLGARVAGVALPPETNPAMFDVARVASGMEGHFADIRDYAALKEKLCALRPQVVFHLAAQALVGEGYKNPLATYASNVMGTAHLLEAVRETGSVKAVVIVTSDKCYENREWVWGYRENEALGGFDPYSSSKACAEIVTAAYRRSFFEPDGARIASARAGNVIGGGDWAADRLLPDLVQAFAVGETALLRRPDAIRPWQHVLEPLSGYLLLARRLLETYPETACAWNFGPEADDARPVAEVAAIAAEAWGGNAQYCVENNHFPHEAGWLRLDANKARRLLGWHPRWNLERAVAESVRWYKAWRSGADMRDFTLEQIASYVKEERS